MSLQFSTRIIAAAGLLAAGFIGLAAAAQTGEVSLKTAGLELKISHSNTSEGQEVEINQEQCPPNCPLFDINWKKYADTTSLKFLR
ncbi:hypothetical protein [Hirschia maritima]|uniref:hypothetical protein n=1 Tax=Hirschia maritima TaxID=1121961 RepID=UPI0003625316|nr:hypothetical protein [Hirschia maritima]